MYKVLKQVSYYITALTAAVSVITVVLGNTNVLAQSCINNDGVNCLNPPSTPTQSSPPSQPTTTQAPPAFPQPSPSPLTDIELSVLSLSANSTTLVSEPGVAVFSISRTGNKSLSLDVPWSIVGKGEYYQSVSLTTAANNSDFSNSRVSGLVRLIPGESSKDFTVNVVHDALFEYEREGFTLCISAPINASINSSQRCLDGAIIDKDALCEYPVSSGLAWFGKVACIIFQNVFTGVVMLPSFILIILPLAVLGTASYFLSLFGFNTRSFAEDIYYYLQNLSGTLSYWLQRPIRSLEPIWLLPPF